MRLRVINCVDRDGSFWLDSKPLPIMFGACLTFNHGCSLYGTESTIWFCTSCATGVSDSSAGPVCVLRKRGGLLGSFHHELSVYNNRLRIVAYISQTLTRNYSKWQSHISSLTLTMDHPSPKARPLWGSAACTKHIRPQSDLALENVLG